MEKRGLSHLEVILSVMLFIGAVSVALFFFDPTSSYTLGEPSYNYIAREIENNLTTNVTIFGVRADSDASKINKINIKRKLENEKLGLIIIDPENSGKINYKVNNFDEGEISWKGNNFVYVIVGENIPLEGGSAPSGEEGVATIASVYTKNVLSEKRVLGLKKNYESNYEIVKKYFSISDNVNFGFELGDIEAKKALGIPEEVSVIASTKRIEVLKKDGDKFEFATLGVKVW